MAYCQVVVGRWLIEGNPKVILFDINSAWKDHNEWRKDFWNVTHIRYVVHCSWYTVQRTRRLKYHCLKIRRSKNCRLKYNCLKYCNLGNGYAATCRFPVAWHLHCKS